MDDPPDNQSTVSCASTPLRSTSRDSSVVILRDEVSGLWRKNIYLFLSSLGSICDVCSYVSAISSSVRM